MPARNVYIIYLVLILTTHLVRRIPLCVSYVIFHVYLVVFVFFLFYSSKKRKEKTKKLSVLMSSIFDSSSMQSILSSFLKLD